VQPVSGACIEVVDAERIGIVLSDYAVKKNTLPLRAAMAAVRITV
jgi:hypothetical protein